MAITRAENQVIWGSPNANSAVVTSSSNQTSDLVTLDTTCVQAVITLKADHSGTPLAGDTVEFWQLGSAGDPDGASTAEYPTDEDDGQFLALLDTFVQDPIIITVGLSPVPQKFYIYAKNNAGSSVTVSATIEELRA